MWQKNENVDGNESNSNQDSTNLDVTNSVPASNRVGASKESRVTHLYRQQVYYPFIKKIRKDKYQYDGDDENIPNHLRAVSWMDGCASQLKLITSKSNMEIEKN